MIFLISLFIIVILHELAHFAATKLCGCGVEVVSVGFGKPFYSFEFKGTRYNFTPWLFGGYCKLKDELTNSNDPTAFTNLPYGKKVIIALAGVAVNIIMGGICLLIGMKTLNFTIWYFGYISLALGITNLLPIPALDGSYPILVWLEKLKGKEKGYALMNKMCRWGFIILMALNIACLPYLYYLIKSGGIR